MRPCDKRRIAVKQDGTGFWLGADYRMGASLIKAQGVQNKIDNTTVGNAVAAGQSAKTSTTSPSERRCMPWRPDSRTEALPGLTRRFRQA